MSPNSCFYRLTCRRCGCEQVCGIEELTKRLRAAGMLRREAKPDRDVVIELFNTSVSQFSCDECNQAGLAIEPAEIDDDWGDTRRCEVCKSVIPAERLEIFPDAKRCVNCEASGAELDEREEADFCRFCGGLMTLRQTGGNGITRHKMVCSDCGR